MSENCWSNIGVWGDRTCGQLETDIHCHNCSVYGQAGRRLLERPEPEGYTAEWTALVASPRDQKDRQKSSQKNGPQAQGQSPTRRSVMVFRLGQEWLALPASIFDQAIAPSPVHALPHHRGSLLRGVVTVRGQLLPCISLHDLLGGAPKIFPTSMALMSSSVSRTAVLEIGQQGGYARLVVIKQLRAVWAFEVDELYGLHRCRIEKLREAPALSNQALASLTESTFSWHGQNVSYLDAEQLFSILQQRAL